MENKKMRVAMIVPYFGRFPSYFQATLDSFGWNKDFFDWYIFTDNLESYQYPDNVFRIRCTFTECKQLIRQAIELPIEFENVNKLCDFKCAYGLIFQKWVVDYAWWGHCDLDQIFGDISRFITYDLLDKYNKIGSIGHFTLYRNTENNNRVFMNQINGRERFREVFLGTEGYAFDEWLPENINEIFLNAMVPVHLENYGADINPYITSLTTVHYDIAERRYQKGKEHFSIFQVENGRLFQIYYDNKILIRKEYPYIHLQKRRIKDKRRKRDTYIITHNMLINNSLENALGKERIWKYINYQYIKVKWNNLKLRIRKRNFSRENTIRFN